MSNFVSRIVCPISPARALHGPNGALNGPTGALDGPTGALDGPNGATWDSPGCNPGFASGINPSALKGPDRDMPRFRRIQAIKSNLRGVGYGG